MGLTADSEFGRLNALRRYAILDTPPEGAFDRITTLAAELLDVPWAVVSLVDTARVWYKSVHGDLGLREVARLPGLCGTAIAHEGPYVVENASADLRTHEHPLVRGRVGLEFYVGVPLRTHDGHTLGTLSCMDRTSRGVTPRELRFLETLAAIVMDEIELRRSAAQIARLSEALAETCNDLERRASFDGLTGVLARSAMLTRTTDLIERAVAGGRGGCAGHGRRRPLQGDQRRTRPCCRGPGAEGDRGADGRQLPRGRPPRPHRRRGVSCGLRRRRACGGFADRRAAARGGRP